MIFNLYKVYLYHILLDFKRIILGLEVTQGGVEVVRGGGSDLFLTVLPH